MLSQYSKQLKSSHAFFCVNFKEQPCSFFTENDGKKKGKKIMESRANVKGVV